MSIDNQVDYDSVKKRTFAEIIEGLANDVNKFHYRGLNAADLLKIPRSVESVDPGPYKEVLVERGILEPKFEDREKGKIIYSLTDKAIEEFDVDEHTVIEHDGETYWAGRDGKTVLAHGLSGKNEESYMLQEIAERTFGIAELGRVDLPLEK